MASRLDLQMELQKLIGVREDGKSNVYFQPPESLKLTYPCIVYSRNGMDIKQADNETYTRMTEYQITVISNDPDYSLVNVLPFAFKMCRYNRQFVSDNLIHDVFTIFY